MAGPTAALLPLPPPSSAAAAAAAKTLTVFIDSTLGTNFCVSVSCHDTIADLKRTVEIEHLVSFPDIGEIVVRAVKVRRRSILYLLPDSMLVVSAFNGIRGARFLHVEAVPTSKAKPQEGYIQTVTDQIGRQSEDHSGLHVQPYPMLLLGSSDGKKLDVIENELPCIEKKTSQGAPLHVISGDSTFVGTNHADLVEGMPRNTDGPTPPGHEGKSQNFEPYSQVNEELGSHIQPSIGLADDQGRAHHGEERHGVSIVQVNHGCAESKKSSERGDALQIGPNKEHTSMVDGGTGDTIGSAAVAFKEKKSEKHKEASQELPTIEGGPGLLYHEKRKHKKIKTRSSEMPAEDPAIGIQLQTIEDTSILEAAPMETIVHEEHETRLALCKEISGRPSEGAFVLQEETNNDSGKKKQRRQPSESHMEAGPAEEMIGQHPKATLNDKLQDHAKAAASVGEQAMVERDYRDPVLRKYPDNDGKKKKRRGRPSESLKDADPAKEMMTEQQPEAALDDHLQEDCSSKAVASVAEQATLGNMFLPQDLSSGSPRGHPLLQEDLNNVGKKRKRNNRPSVSVEQIDVTKDTMKEYSQIAVDDNLQDKTKTAASVLELAAPGMEEAMAEHDNCLALLKETSNRPCQDLLLHDDLTNDGSKKKRKGQSSESFKKADQSKERTTQYTEATVDGIVPNKTIATSSVVEQATLGIKEAVEEHQISLALPKETCSRPLDGDVLQEDPTDDGKKKKRRKRSSESHKQVDSLEVVKQYPKANLDGNSTNSIKAAVVSDSKESNAVTDEATPRIEEAVANHHKDHSKEPNADGHSAQDLALHNGMNHEVSSEDNVLTFTKKSTNVGNLKDAPLQNPELISQVPEIDSLDHTKKSKKKSSKSSSTKFPENAIGTDSKENPESNYKDACREPDSKSCGHHDSAKSDLVAPSDDGHKVSYQRRRTGSGKHLDSSESRAIHLPSDHGNQVTKDDYNEQRDGQRKNFIPETGKLDVFAEVVAREDPKLVGPGSSSDKKPRNRRRKSSNTELQDQGSTPQGDTCSPGPDKEVREDKPKAQLDDNESIVDIVNSDGSLFHLNKLDNTEPSVDIFNKHNGGNEVTLNLSHSSCLNPTKSASDLIDGCSVPQPPTEKKIQENNKEQLVHIHGRSGKESSMVGNLEFPADGIEANETRVLHELDSNKVNFIGYFLPKEADQPVNSARDIAHMGTEHMKPIKEKKKSKSKSNKHPQDFTDDLVNSLNEQQPSHQNLQDADVGGQSLVAMEQARSKKPSSRKVHKEKNGKNGEGSLEHGQTSPSLMSPHDSHGDIILKKKLQGGRTDAKGIPETKSGEIKSSFGNKRHNKKYLGTSIDFQKEASPKDVVDGLAASSDSTEEDTQNQARRYKVAVRKIPSKRFGKAKNTSKANMLATSGTIFNDTSSESSEDSGIINRKAAIEATSDSASRSADSGGTLAELERREIGISSDASNKKDKSLEDDAIMSQSSGGRRKKMPLGSILRSSSSYKKAKLMASQSQADDPKSQPLDVDFMTQTDLAFL